MWKAILKRILRILLRTLSRWRVRGSHRLVHTFGRIIRPSGDIERIAIGRYQVEVNHLLEHPRYMAYGLYETDDLAILKKLLDPGDVVFDVGGNNGYMAAHFAAMVEPEGRVYLFEPSRSCLESLRLVASSTESSVITVVPTAASDRKKTSVYYEPEVILSKGYGMIDQKPSHALNDSYEIETITLDDFAQAHQIGFAKFIKLDVEGHEPQVIRGMKSILSKNPKPLLLVESDFSESTRHQVFEYASTLKGLGYSTWICEPTLKEVDLEGLGSKVRLNVLWVPESLSKRVFAL